MACSWGLAGMSDEARERAWLILVDEHAACPFCGAATQYSQSSRYAEWACTNAECHGVADIPLAWLQPDKGEARGRAEGYAEAADYVESLAHSTSDPWEAAVYNTLARWLRERGPAGREHAAACASRRNAACSPYANPCDCPAGRAGTGE